MPMPAPLADARLGAAGRGSCADPRPASATLDGSNRRPCRSMFRMGEVMGLCREAGNCCTAPRPRHCPPGAGRRPRFPASSVSPAGRRPGSAARPTSAWAHGPRPVSRPRAPAVALKHFVHGDGCQQSDCSPRTISTGNPCPHNVATTTAPRRQFLRVCASAAPAPDRNADPAPVLLGIDVAGQLRPCSSLCGPNGSESARIAATACSKESNSRACPRTGRCGPTHSAPAGADVVQHHAVEMQPFLRRRHARMRSHGRRGLKTPPSPTAPCRSSRPSTCRPTPAAPASGARSA